MREETPQGAKVPRKALEILYTCERSGGMSRDQTVLDVVAALNREFRDGKDLRKQPIEEHKHALA